MHRIMRSLVCTLVLLGALAAHAQQYPAKVITIIVPFAAGGPSDTIARLTAQTMGAALKATMIDRRAGGGGDEYTLESTLVRTVTRWLAAASAVGR